MAVTGTYTVRQVIDAALQDIEAKTLGQASSAAQAEHAMMALNRMMKAWQNIEGTPDMLVTSMTVTATTAASYTLSPVRPLSILSARLKQSGQEIPMIELTRDEYDELPNKDATGTPTQFYYDRQKEAALFYVWPVFSSVSTETFEITYEREFEDVTDLSATIDLPGEWWEAVILNLADRLLPAYGSEGAKQTIPGRAAYALALALGAQAAGDSVYFTRG